MEQTIRLILNIVVVVYSCILHECAHVWVALKMGDPTGKEEGRLTLNPLPHIDLFSTILLPLVTFFTLHFPIGGPKPAPVNPMRTPNPTLTFLLTAVAGPASNLLIALLAFGLLFLINKLGPDWADPKSYNALFFCTTMMINVFLAALNLIPVPPLDGSRVLRYVLPEAAKERLDAIERFGAIPMIIAFWFLGSYVAVFAFGLLQKILQLAFGEPYADTMILTWYSLK